MKSIIALVLLTLPMTVQAYTFDDDVPADIKKQMLDDLSFMASVQGPKSSPLHQQIFGEMSGATYKQFFESRVTGIGMAACGGGKAVACVMPFFDPSKMWLTQNFVKFSHPQIARLMVVYHESRHTEENHGNWRHANCPVPFKDTNGEDMKSIWTGATLAGEPACDITPMGSYGSSLILLKNLSKFCANCNEKVRMDAGIYADDQFKRVISKDAIDAIKNDLYSSAKK